MVPPACSLAEHGFEVIAGLVVGEQLDELLATCPPINGGGLRNAVERWPQARRLVDAPSLVGVITARLGVAPILTRAILFNKSPGRNWALGLHQDTTIAVEERRDVPEFGPWSIKDGVVHVQAPASVLASMVTVRLHIDDADESNGCLRVVPGTHRRGLIPESELAGMDARAISVEVAAGDAVVMRPLLVHGSGRNSSSRERRVLHMEFANAELPGGLRWHRASTPCI